MEFLWPGHPHAWSGPQVLEYGWSGRGRKRKNANSILWQGGATCRICPPPHQLFAGVLTLPVDRLVEGRPPPGLGAIQESRVLVEELEEVLPLASLSLAKCKYAKQTMRLPMQAEFKRGA
jgi:hypothetical protein